VDLRAERTFLIRRRAPATFFDIQNITNRRNVAGFEWNTKTGQLMFGEQAGLLPVFGLNLKP
jgi:hypothetical protein